MLLSQALFEILEEKGLLTRTEVTERMKKLEMETSSRMWRSNDGNPTVPSWETWRTMYRNDDKLRPVQEIAVHGMALTEALYEILADKGLLTQSEVIARTRKLTTEIKTSLH